MLIGAVYLRHPTVGLVAIFIGYAGLAERRHVELLEPIRNLSVRSVMIHSPPKVSMDTPLSELPEILSRCPLPSIPVVGVGDIVTGMLWMEDVSKALQKGCDVTTPVGMVARHDVETLSPHSTLETVLAGPKSARCLPVADDKGRLLGILDLETVHTRGELATSHGREIEPMATKN